MYFEKGNSRRISKKSRLGKPKMVDEVRLTIDDFNMTAWHYNSPQDDEKSIILVAGMRANQGILRG